MGKNNVSTKWRALKTDSFFEMEFVDKANKRKALDAIRTEIKGINYEDART